jgi:hypothetical protein
MGISMDNQQLNVFLTSILEGTAIGFFSWPIFLLFLIILFYRKE